MTGTSGRGTELLEEFLDISNVETSFSWRSDDPIIISDDETSEDSDVIEEYNSLNDENHSRVNLIPKVKNEISASDQLSKPDGFVRKRPRPSVVTISDESVCNDKSLYEDSFDSDDSLPDFKISKYVRLAKRKSKSSNSATSSRTANLIDAYACLTDSDESSDADTSEYDVSKYIEKTPHRSISLLNTPNYISTSSFDLSTNKTDNQKQNNSLLKPSVLSKQFVASPKYNVVTPEISIFDASGSQKQFDMEHKHNISLKPQLITFSSSGLNGSSNIFNGSNSIKGEPPKTQIPVNCNIVKTDASEYTTSVLKTVSLNALEQLHTSLNTCPTEQTVVEDPKCLHTEIKLMSHQKQALAWLIWREKQKPAGGILADDMGLGKTLTMISLVLKTKESETSVYDKSKYNQGQKEKGGTLVVCPATLLEQWEIEIKSKCKDGALSVIIYHGPNRIDDPKQLAKYDFVITTYSLVRVEAGYVSDSGYVPSSSSAGFLREGPLHRVKWERVILDEAHIIRNPKSQCSLAACRLQASYRWVLTGTPIHNRSLDLYTLLKFLRCKPFDDLSIWKKWVGNNNRAGIYRLNTVLKSLMLRRTKQQLQDAGMMNCLPEKVFHTVNMGLDKEEFAVYEQILIFSKSLFQNYLEQRTSREHLSNVTFSVQLNRQAASPLNSSSKLRAMQEKLKAMSNVQQTFMILVLLLRLRQLCCHSALVKSMIDNESCEADGIDDKNGKDLDLMSHLDDLKMKENTKDTFVSVNVLRPDNPVFKPERMSSKMRMLFELLETKVLKFADKAVIVSQWTSMLDILSLHLKTRGISCDTLSGAVPIPERISLVNKFNKMESDPKVLLLSLTAGGVGLNLVGGNHLFLFDLHWNPQLEAQACDRVYRVGQKKTVHIYKFLCDETIEQRIDLLQKQKLQLASNVLSGTYHTQISKLSLKDLRMLFNM